MHGYACIMSDTTVHAGNPRTWMQVEEVAEFLQLTRSTVTRMAANGRIPGAFKPARRWLFRRDAFESWVEAHTTGPRAEAADGTA
jgi:excisionase family DNA binding protein